MNSPLDAVIEVENLSRSFRRKEALKQVTLRVPEGCVFGLVGENGAGKTTLIKHLLGALKPQQGRVRVFGKDPVADPVGVLVDVGHLSEDREMPTWMRIHELLRYIRAFYPNWDADYAQELREMFRLDPYFVESLRPRSYADRNISKPTCSSRRTGQTPRLQGQSETPPSSPV